jgi:UDP-N-acetyl-2-amino-2-deoxyglucuronate dehydrogenase
MKDNGQKNFILLGCSGFVAPRHLQSIKETGNNLIAALDPNDSAGILDKYFPDTSFFTEFERLDRHVEKIKREGEKIDYVSICSPNYLHDAHIRFGLRIGSDVICEKPVVINPWNIDALEEIERKSEGKINTIMQLRLHPSIVDLKNKVENSKDSEIFSIDLQYITPRGKWYDVSWKGDEKKSGGILINIGVHFFDILCWLFGKPTDIVLMAHYNNKAQGIITFKKAHVRWFFSIDRSDLKYAKDEAAICSKIMKVNGDEIDLSSNFNDLHLLSYEKILEGCGTGVSEVKGTLELIYNLKQEHINT